MKNGLTILAATFLLVSTSEANPQGKKYFDMFCQTCHGATGLGDGPGGAALPADKKPRNLQQSGSYKNGSSVEAILKTIENGIPGTLMVSWKAAIPNLADRKAVAEYVKTLQKK